MAIIVLHFCDKMQGGISATWVQNLIQCTFDRTPMGPSLLP